MNLPPLPNPQGGAEDSGDKAPNAGRRSIRLPCCQLAAGHDGGVAEPSRPAALAGERPSAKRR